MSRPPNPDIKLHIQLQLLQLLAQDPHMSQRDLSRNMGAANQLRHAYILTPSGFEEKLLKKGLMWIRRWQKIFPTPFISAGFPVPRSK
jgi:hypothetical protein